MSIKRTYTLIVLSTVSLLLNAATANGSSTLLVGFNIYVLCFVILATVALLAIALVTGFWMIKQKRLKKKMHTLSLEVAKANKEAKSASMVKEVFLQNISHQIRTPLHAINGFAQLLATPEYNFSDADKADFATHIKNNTTILTMLFDDILSIVDIDCGKFEMNITKSKVNEIVYETLETLKHMVSDAVQVTFESAVSDDFTIETDSRRLQQVLMNFLSNAIKHTEKGFIKIEIGLSTDGQNINFSVTDSGEGVPKEMARAIFARFKKLNEFKLGNGLGLSLCKVISEKLHGQCYLDITYPDEFSASTHGARFVCTLPLVQP